MEAQQVFDTVVAHLRQQNSKALMSPGLRESLNMDALTCAYRSGDGKKCAAGALIEDSEYDISMEGKAIFAILAHSDYNCPASLKDRLLPHVKLVGALQGVHDNFPVKEWEEQLQWVAKQFKLNYTAR
jgi:hypothetical protein